MVIEWFAAGRVKPDNLHSWQMLLPAAIASLLGGVVTFSIDLVKRNRKQNKTIKQQHHELLIKDQALIQSQYTSNSDSEAEGCSRPMQSQPMRVPYRAYPLENEKGCYGIIGGSLLITLLTFGVFMTIFFLFQNGLLANLDKRDTEYGLNNSQFFSDLAGPIIGRIGWQLYCGYYQHLAGAARGCHGAVVRWYNRGSGLFRGRSTSHDNVHHCEQDRQPLKQDDGGRSNYGAIGS